jgi:hypothetical protein
MTNFCCCCFANKSKTTTWKKSKQKHWFVYKLYGFCCCAYQNKQRIKSSLFFRMLWPCKKQCKHKYMALWLKTTWSLQRFLRDVNILPAKKSRKKDI